MGGRHRPFGRKGRRRSGAHPAGLSVFSPILPHPAIVSRVIEKIVASAAFRRTIITLILINAITIGMETYRGLKDEYGQLLHVIDRVILALFTLELLLRFLAARPTSNFFRDSWHWFDMAVVAAGYIPGSSFMTIMRLFRILRVLRAITVLPGLRRIVGALLKSLPSLGHIAVLLGLLIYVYAAAGTFLFGAYAPDRFGNLHVSILTLFEVITLEGWVGIMSEIRPHAPACWIYFVSFILFGTFVALNFFVGVIVNNLQAADQQEDEMARIRAALERIEARLGERR